MIWTESHYASPTLRDGTVLWIVLSYLKWGFSTEFIVAVLLHLKTFNPRFMLICAKTKGDLVSLINEHVFLYALNKKNWKRIFFKIK